MTAEELPRRSEWWKWTIVPLRRYAQFGGRSAALEFWMYSLLLLAGYASIMLAGVALEAATEGGFDGTVVAIGMGVFFVATFIPGLALTARRLHDFGFSGHWIWAIYGAMLFLTFIAWFGYLVLMSLPGKKAPNDHGQPVYAEDIAGVFG